MAQTNASKKRRSKAKSRPKSRPQAAQVPPEPVAAEAAIGQPPDGPAEPVEVIAPETAQKQEVTSPRAGQRLTLVEHVMTVPSFRARVISNLVKKMR